MKGWARVWCPCPLGLAKNHSREARPQGRSDSWSTLRSAWRKALIGPPRKGQYKATSHKESIANSVYQYAAQAWHPKRSTIESQWESQSMMFTSWETLTWAASLASRRHREARDGLRDLNVGEDLKDAMHEQVDQVSYSHFTNKIEYATLPRSFTTPYFNPFKEDSDLESHLKHYKNVTILYKSEDVLMCKMFTMTLQWATQDWLHTYSVV